MRFSTRLRYHDRADRAAPRASTPFHEVDPVLRIATVTDIEAMHRVRLSVQENVLRDPNRATYAHYVRYLGPDGRGWVHERDGRIVGFGIADRSSRSIWALFVLPDFQGRGIGRKLLEVTTAWLFEIGTGPVRLTTQAGTRAESFYRVAGWRAIDWPGSAELVFERCADRDASHSVQVVNER
jgi:GNAT superfamily N-acetyltransferase